VVVVADRDEVGYSHARAVADSLRDVAAEISVVESAEGNDVTDHLAAGRALDDLVPVTCPAAEDAATGGDGGADRRQRSQADKLVELVLDGDVELSHTPDSRPHATVPVADRRETHGLRSKGFRSWLAQQLWEAEGKTPSSQAVQDALVVLEGMALWRGDEREVFVRLAEHGGAIYLDLGDESWRVVEITTAGWRVISDSPVRFRRPPGLTALPEPQPGGDIRELRRFLNPGITDDDFVLTVSWLVAALRPRGPYPALHLTGEHGTAKSSEARVLREVVDPNASELRAEPRSGRDLMIAATNAWLVAFDNLSHIQPWLSDALCRLATGGGFSTRVLYTDEEERIFEAERPILLTGIEEVATRADLLDRLVIRQLPVIPDDQRRGEDEFWPAWQAARPAILGALLNAVACALRELPHVRLERLPRMADFARWACAAAPALGWDAEKFMTAYQANRQSANDLALEGSLIAEPLLRLAESKGEFEGTTTDLLTELEALVGDEVTAQKAWPKNAKSLSAALTRVAANLRAAGVEVERLPRQKRRRRVRIRKAPGKPVTTVTPSPARTKSGSGVTQTRPGVTHGVTQNGPGVTQTVRGNGGDGPAGDFSNGDQPDEISRDADPELAKYADDVANRLF
jgi:hypothetical protein